MQSELRSTRRLKIKKAPDGALKAEWKVIISGISR